MSFAERFNNFKTVPCNDVISRKEKKNSLFLNKDVSSDDIKNEILSLADFSSAAQENKTMPLKSSNFFALTQNTGADEKSKKRLYSKPCPKSRKKYRAQSPSFNEEEINLDNDLLGLVGSITDKNLDSDSSNEDFFELNDTIILDDNNPFDSQSNLCSDGNSFKEKNAPTSTFFDSSLRPYISTDGSKHQTFAVEKKKGIKLHSSVPVFKELMPSSFSKSNSSSSTFVSNSPLNENIDITFSTNPKCAKEKTSESPDNNISKVETPVKSPIKNDYLFASKGCQNKKTLNYQSIYASMGLDEDLCDTEQASSKLSVSKGLDESIFCPKKIDHFSEVKIKSETAHSPKECHADKNENLTDDLHVNMIFEAESSQDDEEEEEEVPLLSLKNTKLADMITSPIKSESVAFNREITFSPEKTNITVVKNLTDFAPSLFIKRELIEDEVVSKSQAVSPINQSLNSNAKNTIDDLLPVKIKPEPVGAECFLEDHIKTNTSTLLKPCSKQLFEHSSTLLPKKSSKKKQITKSSKSDDVIDLTEDNNSILSKVLQGENFLSNSFSTTANKHAFSHITAKNASFSDVTAHSSMTELLNSSKPVAKKPVSKKKKTVKKKAANISDSLEKSYIELSSNSELSENLSTVASDMPVLTKVTSDNSSNVNSNYLNASSSKTLDISEPVTKKTFTKNKKKGKALSKKSDLKNISQSISNSKILSTDSRTFEIQEKSTTDSDASVLEIGNLTDSQKKGKRKAEEIDENVPITLLIKRQKSDTDPTDLFLCTNITSRPSTGESRSVSDETEEIGLDQCQKSSLLSDKIDSNSKVLSSEYSDTHQNTKKKKKGKKKVSKKQAKQNGFSSITENNTISTDMSSTEIKEPELKESFNEKNKVTKAKKRTFNSKSSKGKKFSDLPPEDDLYPEFSAFNIQSEESMSSSSFQTSISGDVNSQCDTNSVNSLPIQPKKKKRQRRSNGWYKKKKPKKKKEKSRKNSSVDVDTVEIQNPVLDTRNDQLLTGKTPVVVIKNLNSEMYSVMNNNVKVKDNTFAVQSAEMNSEISSERLEEIPIVSISKTQKKKGNKSRKKTASLESNNLQNENVSSDTSELTSMNCSFDEKIKESNNSSSHEKKNESIEHVSDNDEVSIIELEDSVSNSNLITKSRETSFPSLNIQELAKDIAAFEALIEKQSNLDQGNSASLVDNISRSNLKDVEKQNADKSITLVKDTNKDLPNSSIEKSFKSRNSSGVFNSIPSQSDNSIRIKQEINADTLKSSLNQTDISQLNPFPTPVLNQKSITDGISRNSNCPLVSIKKEKSTESQSSHKNTTSKFIESRTSSSRINNQTGLNSENTDKISSVASIERNTDPNILQNNLLNVSNIGLSIKKEATQTMKSLSGKNQSIRDQNDLIQQACASSSKHLSSDLNTTNSKSIPAGCLSDLHSNSSKQLRKKPLELLKEDEIQIIQTEDIPKEIPCFDLSDDDDDNSYSFSEKVNNEKISEYDAITSISSGFIEFSKRIKTENENSKKSSVTPEASNDIVQRSNVSKQVSTFSFTKSDEIQNLVDPSKIRTDVSDSNLANTGSYVSEDPIKRETGNPFIVRDKYIDEYFKHPFPSTIISYKKRRSRSKIYERIDSKAWNLSIDAVESRLKLSENVITQFGKILGDIIKLEKYPVSKSEVECYHRILGVAPSHKLLSKCYLAPNQKFHTVADNEVDKLEQLKHQTKDTSQLTINDILQGINESKMMCRTVDSETDSTILDRDCPSAETKDSFDSNVSHSIDMCVNTILDKNVERLNLNSVKGNELRSSLDNTFVTPQSSSLLCTANFEDSSNNAVNNIASVNTLSDSDVIKSNEVSNLSFIQNNVLTTLILPSKETVSNILNSRGSNLSTVFETSDMASNSGTESNNNIMNATVDTESSLSSSYSQLGSGVSSEVNTSVAQNRMNTNKMFDIINMPVLELRKILETASNLQSNSNDNEKLQPDNADNVIQHADIAESDSLNSDNLKQDGIWKNKETFEYNHTQSFPLTNDDPIQNTERQEVDGFSESVKDTEEQIRNENSDDEYVDNEPMVYDDDDSSPENEEPEPLPIYKSKWEKIMERKSQELKEKEKVSELYFNDCVPVSTRLKTQSKKVNINDKVSPPGNKKSVKSDKNPNTNVPKKASPKKKTGSNKGKQTESNISKTITEVVKNNTLQELSKKSEKNNSKDEERKATKTKSPLKKDKTKESPMKKNKTKETDRNPNLFVPDKLVKSPVKKISVVTSNEKSNSKRFYGNRVTNRGTFLTEVNSKNSLSNIKIPKKKTSEGTRKLTNVHSDEFHSMIKSPDINIDLPRVSSGKNFNKTIDTRKSTDVYKSPLSDARPSTTSHFMRNKRMRDRQNAYYNSRSHFIRRNDSHDKKNLLETSYLQSPPHSNDEIVPKSSPLLPNLPNHHSYENSIGQNTSHLHSENSIGQKAPFSGSPPSNPSHIPSNSFQLNINPSKEYLQQIMSVFQNNPNGTSEIDGKMFQNPENVDAAFNNNQYNAYGAAESSVVQNINFPPVDLQADTTVSLSNPFGNISQIDSLNLQREAVGLQYNNAFPYNVSLLSNSLTESLDPRRAALGLQSNMASNSIMAGSPKLTDTLDPRRAALGLPHNVPISTSPADPRRTALMSPTNIPTGSLIPINSSFIDIPLPSESLDPRKAALGMHQNALNSKSSMNIGSQILNSPPCITSTNSASQQPSRKATCLVPPHLKSLVGHQTIETHNVQLLILEWSVDWLIQQQKMKDPPPISNALKKVTSSYDSFEDYYNTYFPLMLLETWHRIFVSWTHLNQTAPFLCQITSYSVKTHYVSVECQTLFSTDNRRKGIFPDEGSILMVKYSTKANEYTIKILGYVTHVKTRRYNPVTDSKICSSLPQQKDINQDSLQILTLTFMGAYNSEDIDKRQPVRIHVLCTVKQHLKQNDAMLYINKSPLQRIILNPVADGLLTFSLTPRNSPEDKVNECVRDITKGILSPHPLPLLTVVRAKPESDRLNIIPLLILKMKTAYKTKVLLCVRTVRALGDIAANICLQQSLNLVIVNKRCDTNLQFQKYLLDERVSSEAKKLEEDKTSEKNLKSDTYIKIKKQIIKDCDVLLSLVKNSHDDFLDQTFHETESIAQMCCIIDEANLCTEPETLIPILHGISKLILIGDPDYTAKVLSKTASSYDFNQSFFQRAYDLDLLTE